MNACCLILSVNVTDRVRNFQVMLLQSCCSKQSKSNTWKSFISHHNITFIQDFISVYISSRISHRNFDIKESWEVTSSGFKGSSLKLFFEPVFFISASDMPLLSSSTWWFWSYNPPLMHQIFFLIYIRVSTNGLGKYLRQSTEYIFDFYHVLFCCQYTLASTAVIPGENSAENLFSIYAVKSIT
jgi:hypothetical protein